MRRPSHKNRAEEFMSKLKEVIKGDPRKSMCKRAHEMGVTDITL